LDTPRNIWLMLPAAIVDSTLDKLVPLLDKDDAVIDGGNSYYRDDIKRAATLKRKGIHYLDCGTSGGVWGLERGYCLMIGGREAPRPDLQDHRTRQGKRGAHTEPDAQRHRSRGLPALRAEWRRALREDGAQRRRVRDDGRDRRRPQHHQARRRRQTPTRDRR